MKKIQVRKPGVVRLTTRVTPLYSIMCHVPNVAP
jgi:hypothetical protein